MLYLAPYEGSGTKTDPFRPKGSRAFARWGAVDLRPSGKVTDGYCLFMPPTDADLDGCIKLGMDKDEATASATRTQLGNRLSLDLSGCASMQSVVGELLFKQGKAWKGVIANPKGEKHVYIGGRLWAFKQCAVPRRGELIDPTDNFNRADEDPIASPWFTPTGAADQLRIVSNQMAGPGSDGNAAAGYTGAAATGDHYSQFTLANAGTGSANDWGVAARVQSGAFTFYFWSVAAGNWSTQRVEAGSFTVIEDITDGTISVSDTARLEVSGSTLTCKQNGVEVTDSPSTDAVLTGGQPGVFIFDTAVRLDSFDGGDLTGTAALTGTLGDGATEAQIVAGGQVLTITLTGDSWIPA